MKVFAITAAITHIPDLNEPRHRCSAVTLAVPWVMSWITLIWLASGASATLVVNGGFETVEATFGGPSFPSTFGDWHGDVSEIVSIQDGITPFDSNMLHFINALKSGPDGGNVASSLWQIVDVSPHSSEIAAGTAYATFSAQFNRVLGDSQTDTVFFVELSAYQGLASSFPTQAATNSALADSRSVVVTDGDVTTWEAAMGSLLLPSNTDFIVIEVDAFENVFNDATNPEFDGHYADNVSVTIFPEPPSALVQLDVKGASYTQAFDSTLGADGADVGVSLPLGWEAVDNGITNTFTTKTFPPASVTFGTYNAGAETDRTLATGNDDRTGENHLQLGAELTDGDDVRAVRLAFSIEAWAGSLNADSPGEAAYVVELAVDRTGNGDFGRIFAFNHGANISTGLTLAPGLLDGNSDANRTMFDSGLVELPEAIPAGSTIRLTFDARNVGQTEGYLFGLDDVLFRIVAPGDTDGNGVVDSDDLFAILAAGKFNHPDLGPASWGEGDFTGDDLVNSDDLFAILGAAKFNAGPYTTATPPAALATVPEPSTFILAAIALVGLLPFARGCRRMMWN